MEYIVEFISSYISYWPVAAFCVLILAGFNLPVSEDAVIILSATMVHQNKKLLIPTYLALYSGIFISDIIAFCIGRLLSKGFLQFKFLKKKLTPENMEWVSSHLENHGFKTFITCRFIPFGVRNMLFMGSGFVGLPFSKFVLFDCIAALISSSTLFILVYFIGNAAKEVLYAIGIILFVAVIIAAYKFFSNKKNKKKELQNQNEEV